MDVRLSDEQLQLVDLARRIGTASAPQSPARTSLPLDTAGWAALNDAGLTTLLAPDPAGGGTVLDVALVVEQMGTALSPLPYVGSVLAHRLLLDSGAGRPTCLPLALGLDATLSSPGTAVAWDAVGAAEAIGIQHGAVMASSIGGALESADLTRSLAEAVAPVSIGALSSDGADRWQALTLTLLSADLLGVMQGTLDAAVAHARDREQFGRPIGSVQAVQHLCADQLVRVEGTRSAVWHAAWAVDEMTASDALLAARIAKAWASRMAVEVCEAAVQVWGGLGMTWECSAHSYLRRALLDRRTFGDERTLLAHIADARLGPLR